MKNLVIATAIIAASSVALATTTTHLCQSNNLQRRVELTYDEANTAAPCSVQYYKDSEEPGKPARALYNAQNDSNYCVTKTQEFLQKLNGMGWSCTNSAEMAKETAPAAQPAAAAQEKPATQPTTPGTETVTDEPAPQPKGK